MILYTTVTAGTTITAAWGNNVRDGIVSGFASVAARASARSSPIEGMVSYRQDAKVIEVYNATVDVQLQPVGGNVPNSQTTTSTSFTDLSTAGPAVTVNTGTSALVHVNCKASCSVADGVLMGFAVSGASTVAAAAAQAVQMVGTSTFTIGASFLITGLTAGSNVFTAKYRISFSGTGTFADRNIVVQPLP